MIMLILFLLKKINKKISSQELNDYRNNKDMKLEKDVLEALWSQVDALRPDERKVLKEFIDSGNLPIEKSSGTHYFGNSIFNSNWLISTEAYGEEKQEIIFSDNVNEKMIPKDSNIFIGGRTIIKKYKLNDDIYQALKYSMDNYGRISHFE